MMMMMMIYSFIVVVMFFKLITFCVTKLCYNINLYILLIIEKTTALLYL